MCPVPAPWHGPMSAAHIIKSCWCRYLPDKYCVGPWRPRDGVNTVCGGGFPGCGAFAVCDKPCFFSEFLSGSLQHWAVAS